MFRGGIWSFLGVCTLLTLAAGPAHAGVPSGSCGTANVESVSGCTVNGAVFADLNRDGQQGADEQGIAGWTVFGDFNGNAQPDPGEPSALTGPGGGYALAVPAAFVTSPFDIYLRLQQGWECVAPASCSYHEQPFLIERSGHTVPVLDRLGRDFAASPIPSPPPPLPPPPPPPPPAAAPSRPASGVGARRSTGRASFRTPRGCPARRVRLVVRGRGVANVSFYLGKRKLITIIRPDSRGRFKRTIKTSKLKAGVHRVRARVTFTWASATASKMLTARIQRCATRATPKFTG